MCFSAEASFSAAIILTGIGYATLKKNASKSQFFLAAIPYLFAIQQFAEGLLWLHLSKHIIPNFISTIAERIFLTFAFLIWPIWIPFSIARLEKIAWRRNVLYANLACGIMLSLLNLSYAFEQNISIKIINHSIQYIGRVPSQGILYPIIVLLPCFISSYKNIWMFSFLTAISYLVANYYYETTFVSVWCFFTALISIIVYKIVKDNQVDLEKIEHKHLR